MIFKNAASHHSSIVSRLSPDLTEAAIDMKCDGYSFVLNRTWQQSVHNLIKALLCSLDDQNFT